VKPTPKAAVERGSGNVFADLGLPEADTHLLKAELVSRIVEILRQRRITQAQTAALLGLSQPDVSRLLRGNFRDHSVERIFRLLTTLGRDVEITIRKLRAQRPGRLCVEAG
jgi:predicted XRE-type DNA-binding protein